MKNHATPISTQIRVTMLVKRHSASCDFAVSHTVTAKKLTTSVCYIINRSFWRKITNWFVHSLIQVVGGLHTLRYRTWFLLRNQTWS